MNFVIRLLINAVALAAAERLIDGITYTGEWIWLIAVALIFGLVNATIGPLLKMLTCPLIVLTLGLFTLVINGLMLQLTAYLAGFFDLSFRVDSYWAAFLGALVISIVSFFLSLLLGGLDNEKDG
jgi:putative membrane protein